MTWLLLVFLIGFPDHEPAVPTVVFGTDLHATALSFGDAVAEIRTPTWSCRGRAKSGQETIATLDASTEAAARNAYLSAPHRKDHTNVRCTCISKCPELVGDDPFSISRLRSASSCELAIKTTSNPQMRGRLASPAPA